MLFLLFNVLVFFLINSTRIKKSGSKIKKPVHTCHIIALKSEYLTRMIILNIGFCVFVFHRLLSMIKEKERVFCFVLNND